jgi:hypothetical protein
MATYAEMTCIRLASASIADPTNGSVNSAWTLHANTAAATETTTPGPVAPAPCVSTYKPNASATVQVCPSVGSLVHHFGLQVGCGRGEYRRREGDSPQAVTHGVQITLS